MTMRIPLAILSAMFLGMLTSGTALAQDRHILLEEFSTARCGFCPDGTLIAAQVVRDHPSVIWVTHHAGFGVDSMTTPESKAIAGAFTNFAPGACIDRGVYPKHVSPYIEEYGKIATTRSKWDSVITAHLGDEQYAALTISSSYDPSTTEISVSVDVQFSALPPAGDIRMNLFIVEDSVIGYGEGYDQKNYYDGTSSHPMYGLGNPIVGYAHHRVVSGVPTGDWGAEGIIPTIPELGTSYDYSWTGPLTAVWDKHNQNRPDLISFVAFLSYYDVDPKKRQVIHAAEAHLDVQTSAPALPDDITLSIQAYPNPAVDETRFVTQHGAPHGGTLLVTDFAGRTVTQYHVPPGVQRFRLRTAVLPAGTYFYRFFAGSQAPIAGKLLIIR